MTPKQIIPNYKDPISFRKLAEQDEDFAKVVSKSGAVDWQDAQAVKQLTKSLLKRDFGIQIEFPDDDRLCPPVPNRFLYIRWIQKLLDSTSSSFMREYDQDRQVLGIDIGTGASCIYPLLGTASRPTWSFYGTDIDTTSLQSAFNNITLNNLNDRIRLHQSSPSSHIIPLDALFLQGRRADFTMCNPPFYESKQDMAHSLLRKTLKPNAVCTGAEVEIITEGGELAFARKILNESCMLKGRVQWYTIMFGKLESLVPFVESLKKSGCVNWCLGVLAPGQLTKRWVVGWSWMGFRPSCKLVRPEADFPSYIGKNIFCYSPSSTVHFGGSDAPAVAKHLHDCFSKLRGRSKWKDDGSACLLQTPGDVWSRRARRKQKALEMGGNTAHAPSDQTGLEGDGKEEEERFVMRIDVEDARIVVNWLFGMDHVLFESFCGFVRRQMEGFPANPNELGLDRSLTSRSSDREDVDMGMD